MPQYLYIYYFINIFLKVRSTQSQEKFTVEISERAQEIERKLNTELAQKDFNALYL